MTDTVDTPSPLPTPRQLEYQDWEMGLFLHFGIRTFYEGHRDWDGKPMAPEGFRPSAFDANQWAAAAAEAGMKYMVLTAKHHDGFANWPSARSEYSVAHTPWKDGRGDVIAEYVAACRAHGLAVGLYYSPAEQSARFKAGSAEDYDEHFLAQITELLGGAYGPIDILWFDGCGSEGHEYDWPRLMREVRRMQPNLLIFNMGDPDFRWVGNEAGLAPQPCWNVVDEVPFSILTEEGEKLQGARRQWLPAECDCRMRLQNWFYSDADEHTVKSLDELMGLYYYSVGRGCNLLLNIGPDRRGLLPALDAARLVEFGQEVRRRFARPLATLGDFTQTSPTTWQVRFDDLTRVDHVVIQEDLTRGENIRRFEVRLPHGRDGVALWQGTSVGHKAVCHFPLARAPVLDVEVLEQSGPVSLRALSVYNASCT